MTRTFVQLCVVVALALGLSACAPMFSATAKDLPAVKQIVVGGELRDVDKAQGKMAGAIPGVTEVTDQQACFLVTPDIGLRIADSARSNEPLEYCCRRMTPERMEAAEIVDKKTVWYDLSKCHPAVYMPGAPSARWGATQEGVQ